MGRWRDGGFHPGLCPQRGLCRHCCCGYSCDGQSLSELSLGPLGTSVLPLGDGVTALYLGGCPGNEGRSCQLSAGQVWGTQGLCSLFPLPPAASPGLLWAVHMVDVTSPAFGGGDGPMGPAQGHRADWGLAGDSDHSSYPIRVWAMAGLGRGPTAPQTLGLTLLPSLRRMVEYSLDLQNINLSAIRTVRVLRPLKAINRVPSELVPPALPQAHLATHALSKTAQHLPVPGLCWHGTLL